MSSYFTKFASTVVLKLSLADRERRQLSDLVSKLRTDREVLDSEAFLAQRQITELKNKVEKQETDIANLNLRRNTLQGDQIADLMSIAISLILMSAFLIPHS